MFHSSLQIGAWIIEWNDSAICIPRKCMSKAALISADIEAIHTSEKIKEVVDTLANFIVDWNIKMEYKENTKGKNEANCQDFIISLLKQLKINVNFEGPLGIFLNKLKEKGKCELEFEPTKEFQEKFQLKEKSITFKTHLELDEYASKIGSMDAQFGKITWKNEYALLKSFDRAFWLRHFKTPEDKTYHYLIKESEEEGASDCGCSFGDPRETRSIIL